MMPASNQGLGMNIGFPDVCLTPAAPAPLPIPYPNLGMNAMAMPFCPNIFISFIPGHNMAAKPLMTNGDNAGVAHPLCMQPGGTTMGNPKILLTGLPAEHMLVPTNGNNFNNPIGAKLVPSITNVLLCSLGATAPELGAGELPETRWSQAALETTALELRDLPAPSLGITTESAPGGLRVVHVRRQGPGAEAGLAPGDLLVSVAGQPTADLEELPRPVPGQELELEFLREGARHTTTAAWEANSLPVEGRIERGRVAVVEIRRFSLAVAEELDRELERLVRAGARSLILDLRGNPGGALSACLEVAGLLLPEGAPIGRLLPRGQRPRALQARGSGRWQGLPLFVVLDSQTASAGEVLAAGLQDTRRALLVGETTFGKGVAESPAGAWAAVRRSAGEALGKVGVHPDRVTSSEDALESALELALRSEPAA